MFAYAAAQVKHMLEVTQRLGGENYVLWGGREGYDTLLNTDLAREGAQLARFLHLVAEHKHRIGFGGQLLIEPKPMEPTKHQYDYDVSTVYGFLVRNGLEDEYRVNIEANHATLAGHSFHHEVAFAAANGILGSIDANRGDPQNGWDTDQFPNSVEDLALAALRDPPGRWHRARRLQLRCQAAPPEHRSDRPVPRPHRRSRHARPGAAGGGRPDRDADAWPRCGRRATRAGAARSGARSSTAPRRWRRSRRRSRPARSIPGPCRATRSCSRTSSTSRPGGRPSGAGRVDRRPLRVGLVLGIDVSTTATKAVLVDETGAVRGVGTAEYGFSAPHPLWSEQDPAAWWDGAVAAIGSVLATAGVSGDDVVAIGLTGQMHGLVLLDDADRVLRPAILWNDQRTAAECDAIRAAVGPERLVAITGNDALTGFTAPKLVWVRDHEPEVWSRAAHVLLPKDYLRLRLTGEHAMDKADGAGTILFDLAARDWSPEVARRAPDPARLAAADVRGPGGDRHGHGAAPPPPRGCVPAPRSSPAAATRRPTRSASGSSRPGEMALSLGTSGVVFAATDRPLLRAGGRSSTPSATPCPVGGT